MPSVVKDTSGKGSRMYAMDTGFRHPVGAEWNACNILVQNAHFQESCEESSQFMNCQMCQLVNEDLFSIGLVTKRSSRQCATLFVLLHTNKIPNSISIITIHAIGSTKPDTSVIRFKNSKNHFFICSYYFGYRGISIRQWFFVITGKHPAFWATNT